jgi:hypothetical protein
MVVGQAPVARAIGSGAAGDFIWCSPRTPWEVGRKRPKTEEVAWKNMQAYAGPSFDDGSWSSITAVTRHPVSSGAAASLVIYTQLMMAQHYQCLSVNKSLGGEKKIAETHDYNFQRLTRA